MFLWIVIIYLLLLSECCGSIGFDLVLRCWVLLAKVHSYLVDFGLVLSWFELLLDLVDLLLFDCVVRVAWVGFGGLLGWVFCCFVLVVARFWLFWFTGCCYVNSVDLLRHCFYDCFARGVMFGGFLIAYLVDFGEWWA